MQKTLTEAQARAAFRAREYREVAVLYHAHRAASARVKHRPPFTSPLAKESFYAEAETAADAAAQAWHPRGRPTWADFERHVFNAVDRALRQPHPGQGIATGIFYGRGGFPVDGKGEILIGPDGNVDHRDSTYRTKALDLSTAAPSGSSVLLATPGQLKEFARLHPREHRLATAVAPYTDTKPERYAQQLLQKSRGHTDDERVRLVAEIGDAATMLRVFLEVERARAVPAMLDFEGVCPTPAHHILYGLAPLLLPGIPPVGAALEGPFGLPPDELYRVAEKEDGRLQPLARQYLLKLAVWLKDLSAAVIEQDARRPARERTLAGLRELVQAKRDSDAVMAKSEAGQAALAVDARKALKKKKSTRKPPRLNE